MTLLSLAKRVLKQLSDLAKILAVDVLPIPLEPINKSACGKEADFRIFCIFGFTNELSSSDTVLGRYLR